MERKTNCIRSIITDYILDVHIPNILLGIGASIEVPMVTLLGRRLRASQSRIAMFVLISSLCRSALDIPFGIITEYIGVRNVMLASLLLNALAALIGWRIHSVMSLVVYCVLSGTSLGAFFLSRHIFVASISSRRHRGIVMSFLSGLLRWAHVLGPTAIGLITSWTHDVRDAFVFAFCTSLAAFVSIIGAPILRSATHSIPALSLTTSPTAHNVDREHEENDNNYGDKFKENDLYTNTPHKFRDKSSDLGVVTTGNDSESRSSSSRSVRSINSTQSFTSALSNNTGSINTNRLSKEEEEEEKENVNLHKIMDNQVPQMESDVADIDFGLNKYDNNNIIKGKYERTNNTNSDTSHTVDTELVLQQNTENNIAQSNASASLHSEPVMNSNKSHINEKHDTHHKNQRKTRMLAHSLPPLQMHRGHGWSSMERQPRQVVSVNDHELQISKTNHQLDKNNGHKYIFEEEKNKNIKEQQENTEIKWRRRRYNMSPHPLEPDNFYNEHHTTNTKNNNVNNKFNLLRINTKLHNNNNKKNKEDENDDDETPHYHIHINPSDIRLHQTQNEKLKIKKEKMHLYNGIKNNSFNLEVNNAAKDVNRNKQIEEEEEEEEYELKRAYTTSSIPLHLPLTPTFSLTTLAPGLATQSTDDLSLHALFITLCETWHIIWRLGMAVVFFSAVRANRKLMMAFASMRAEMSDVQLSYVLSFGFCFDALLFPLGGIVMEVMGRYHALIPVSVGFGIVFTLLPWCTTTWTVYVASALFGIADSLSCGVVMTLTADYAPKIYGAPFFGIIRTLEDLGHVLGAGGSSLLLRMVGFDMTSWGLALQSGLIIIWVLLLLPCYNCNIDTPVPESRTHGKMKFDNYYSFGDDDNNDNSNMHRGQNVNNSSSGVKKRFFTPDVPTSTMTTREPSQNNFIPLWSSLQKMSANEPLLSQNHNDQTNSTQKINVNSGNINRSYGATATRETHLLLPLPFTKRV